MCLHRIIVRCYCHKLIPPFKVFSVNSFMLFSFNDSSAHDERHCRYKDGKTGIEYYGDV